MKAEKVDYYLTVTPTKSDPGSKDFKLANQGNRNPDNYLKDDGTLDFTGARKKFFKIHFTLLEGETYGLRFLPSVKDAIWIATDGSCPTEKPLKQPDEFEQGELSADRTILSIVNKNKTKKSYGYALRFEREGSTVPKLFDPVVISGGGGN